DLDRDMMLARFRREVQAVGALRHDHVIRAHDAGADAEGPYLVMEYLDGEPLSRLLARRGPLPVGEACELVRQAALGLQAAHLRPDVPKPLLAVMDRMTAKQPARRYATPGEAAEALRPFCCAEGDLFSLLQGGAIPVGPTKPVAIPVRPRRRLAWLIAGAAVV